MKCFLILFTLILSITSCLKKTEFNKEKWNKRNSMGYHFYRDEMLDNLLKTQELKGKNLNELKNIFGIVEVDTFDNLSYINFNIVTDFGFDIDPVYTKDLILELNDSIVQKVRVEIWNKE
jgi:opacity protein-like surface antigen